MLPTRASRLCHELCVCVYVFGRRQIVHKIRPRILALCYTHTGRYQSYLYRSRRHEIPKEAHNWFLNQFVEISRRSIIFCFLSLSTASAALKWWKV